MAIKGPSDQRTVLWRLRMQEHAGHVAAALALIRDQSRLMSHRRDAHDLFHCRRVASWAERSRAIIAVGSASIRQDAAPLLWGLSPVFLQRGNAPPVRLVAALQSHKKMTTLNAHTPATNAHMCADPKQYAARLISSGAICAGPSFPSCALQTARWQSPACGS
jgi:hypothetical protein